MEALFPRKILQEAVRICLISMASAPSFSEGRRESAMRSRSPWPKPAPMSSPPPGAPSAVEETARAIERLGGKTLRVTSDVADRKLARAALANVSSGNLGPVSILFNCAGITQRVPTLECTEELWNSDHRHQPDRHASRLPDLRPRHDRARLRTHHQYRVARDLRRLHGGRSLRSEQGSGRCADEVAGSGVGASTA